MNRGLKIFLFLVWLFLLVWGATGVMQRFTMGHKLANYGSYVPWGLWVAAKVYFVGLGVGTSLFAWAVIAFKIEKLKSVIKPSLLISIACLVGGMTIITFDLGHMFRSFEVFYRPNFKSMLAIATWLSFIYLGYVAIALLANLHKDFDAIPRAWGWIGLILGAFFSMGINGSEFATLVSSPYWHSSLAPLLSITGDLLTGISLVLGFIALFPYSQNVESEEPVRIMRWLCIGFVLFVLALEMSDFVVSAWYQVGESYPIINEILFGHYSALFWVVHVIIGSIIPLFLLTTSPSRTSCGISGFMIAISYFALRYIHVLPGQTTERLPGIAEAYVDHRLRFAYSPSAHEWAVIAFGVALTLAIYYVGSRFLLIGNRAN